MPRMSVFSAMVLSHLRGRDGPAEDLLPAGGGRHCDGHALGFGVDGFHTPAEHDLVALTVVEHRHDRADPHSVVQVSGMTFSVSLSPTFTESNLRRAIGKTLSSLIGTPSQGRVCLLDDLAGLVRDDVLGHDDVGAERLPDRMHADLTVELVAGADRF